MCKMKAPSGITPYRDAGGQFGDLHKGKKREIDLIELTAIRHLKMEQKRVKALKKGSPTLPSPGTAAPHSVLDFMHGKVLHIDQTIGRCNNNGKLGCLTRGSTIFLYGPDIVLPGSLHPVLAGFPNNFNNLDWSAFIATKHKRSTGVKMSTSTKAK